MKRKEMTYLIGGLLMGFVIGAALFSDEDLRTGLLGTAVDPGSTVDNNTLLKKVEFYLVPIDGMKEWLAAQNPQTAERLDEDMTNVAGLASAEDVGQYYTDNRESVDTVLVTLHSTLIEEENLDEVTTCIALDNDPTSTTGPGLYLYLEVPSDKLDTVPETWVSLDEPREDSLLWSATCYQEESQ